MEFSLRSDLKRITIVALITLVSFISIVGCASQYINLAPPSSSQPLMLSQVSEPYNGQDIIKLSDDSEISLNIDNQHAYSLPELINLAQQKNPDTRIAWEQARQAALAVGMVEATFLPVLSASVVTGYQKLQSPLPLSVGQYSDIDSTNSAVVPALGLQWLLFDFGQRSALSEGASHTVFAANIIFNGVHQKIINDVTYNYHMYGAAQSRSKINAEMLENSMKIFDAAQTRQKQGVATIIDVAQAQQLVAQSKLNLVLAQGMEDDSRQALLRAIGISPLSQIKVAYDEVEPLPKAVSRPTEAMIKQALSQRSDVQAGYAMTQAAKSAVKVTEADFLPKVYLAGVLARGHGRFETEGLPTATPQTSSYNIVLGVRVPLYDGGIRQARVQEAESRVNVSNENLKKIQGDAYREIVIASNTLRSTLESNQAALRLVKTATITFEASLDAYRHGVGTITIANEAANSLLTAKQMYIDARAAAFIAATNLAFVMGRINQHELQGNNN